MSKIKIEFETNNAAFDEAYEWEVKRILERIASRLEVDPNCEYLPIMDSNGNKVGEFNAMGDI